MSFPVPDCPHCGRQNRGGATSVDTLEHTPAGAREIAAGSVGVCDSCAGVFIVTAAGGARPLTPADVAELTPEALLMLYKAIWAVRAVMAARAQKN